MNTPYPNIEPRWATYLKAAAFLVPAIFLWSLSAVFVVPKLQRICAEAGLPGSGSFWSVTQLSIHTALFFRQNGILIAGAIIVMLGLLEWRSSGWPRYRRTTVGVGTFVLNLVVLISLFVMFVAVTAAAPALAHRGQ